MADTTILRSNPRAVTLMSVSLQAESIRHTMFMKQMSGPMPSQAMALAKTESQQTTPGMPIVQIHDLKQKGGDRVTMDLYNLTGGKPTMGDKKIEGRGEKLAFKTMDLVIQQTRKAVDPGGNMTQKRTPHDLRKISRANLANWFARYNEQMIQVHLAGARGTEDSVDWIVPLDTDPDFAEMAINDILPPTTNRYYVAGGGDDASQIGVEDALTLEDMDVVAADLREQALPPAPIQIEHDLQGNDRPLWCWLLSERQWHFLEAIYGKNTWRQYMADATQRYMVTKHPLFLGTTAMWNGMILKRMSRPIRFKHGDTVKTTDADTGNIINTEITDVAVSSIDRSILLGAQALAMAWGNAGNPQGPFPMKWSEIMMDHGNSIEICGGQMEGKKKIRYTQTDGKVTDFGVVVVDSYAPDVKSPAATTLRSALSS